VGSDRGGHRPVPQDHPTLDVNDVLRRILFDPRYPQGTQHDYANLLSVLRTAQDVLRDNARRCVTTMQPVYDMQDRNDPPRVQVVNSITYMLYAQASRTEIPTFEDAFRVSGPLNPPLIDLIETSNDCSQPDPAQ